MPMRPYIHPPAIGVPAVVSFDVMTMPPLAVGDEHRFLACRPDGDLRRGGPLVLG